MFAMLIALATLQAGQLPVAEARSPSWSPDGRLVFASGGDLWVVNEPQTPGARPVRITEGPSWDRDPVWAGPGALLFSSDRAGSLDIWRVQLGPGGPGQQERLTTHPEPETEPVHLSDGSVVFVRGRADAADLWQRLPDGTELQLTDEPGADVAPAVAGDGNRFAWLAQRAEGVEVRSLHVTTRAVTGFPADGVQDVSWSPSGDRLALVLRGSEAGVWLANPDGTARVRVGAGNGPVTWSPDGAWLAVGAEPPTSVGYNGDPDRVPDREAGSATDVSAVTLRLLPTDTLAPASQLAFEIEVAKEETFAAEFDRVWQRVARLYTPDAAAVDAASWTRQWEAVRARHRPTALAASSLESLDAAVHAMLRERPPTHRPASGRAAVSSAHPAATAAGVEILEAGGNVVDAAVAVSFAIGVVEPDASGVGGYGEMVIHLEEMREPTAIEFMTRHPEALGPVPSGGRLEGPRRVNVPGTVAGMEMAWRKYGSGNVSWARVVEPAIRLAEEGFPVSDGFATTLRREWLEFSKSAEAMDLFFPRGRPLATGDILRNPDLGRTLRMIAEGGADAFYRGDIARRIVADLSASGNPIRLSDFERYVAVERRPIRTTYRGHAVYAGPPPVTGGAVLAGKLNLLERTEPGRSLTEDPDKLHALIEAWKLQPSTRGRIADPDHWAVDVTPFENKDTAAARWRCFDPASAASAADIQRCMEGGDPRPAPDPRGGMFFGHTAAGSVGEPATCDTAFRCRSTGTTAFAVADARGNAVSVTQTLGTWGGNFHVTPGLGFLYNDKATSFRGDPEAFGAPRPFGRVGTVISPALVFDGAGEDARPLLAVGAAGNAWITSAVFMAVVGVIDHGLGPQEVLELPRLLVSGGGFRGVRETVVQIEDGFSPAAIRRLEAMGHDFRRISLRGELRMGYGAAVLIRDGQAIAGADPRRSGAAGAVR